MKTNECQKTQKMTSHKIANCFRSALDLLFLKLREAAYVHRLTDSKLVFGSNLIAYKRKSCYVPV